MLTLSQIKNVHFKRMSLGGYNTREVKEFISEVEQSFSEILEENQKYKSQIVELKNEVEHYNSHKNAINDVLIKARSEYDNLISEAQSEAKSILEKAEFEASRIAKLADEEAKSIREKPESEIRNQFQRAIRMQQNIAEFKTKLLVSYKNHLKLLNEIDEDAIFNSLMIKQREEKSKKIKEETVKNNFIKKEKQINSADTDKFIRIDGGLKVNIIDELALEDLFSDAD